MAHAQPVFKFPCPHCGQRIAVTAADSGSTSHCPSCHATLVVPADLAGDTEDKFKFPCPTCGQRIAATAADVGTENLCPACAEPLIVPPPTLRVAVKRVLPPSPAPAQTRVALTPGRASRQASRKGRPVAGLVELPPTRPLVIWLVMGILAVPVVLLLAVPLDDFVTSEQRKLIVLPAVAASVLAFLSLIFAQPWTRILASVVIVLGAGLLARGLVFETQATLLNPTSQKISRWAAFFALLMLYLWLWGAFTFGQVSRAYFARRR